MLDVSDGVTLSSIFCGSRACRVFCAFVKVAFVTSFHPSSCLSMYPMWYRVLPCTSVSVRNVHFIWSARKQAHPPPIRGKESVYPLPQNKVLEWTAGVLVFECPFRFINRGFSRRH